ncbi:MAG: M15 family metallopeptidase [Treponema sp.]|nr:M15 family metallopeptidase [Treponema sp.]
MKIVAVFVLSCFFCISCTTAKTVGITPKKRVPPQITHFIQGYPTYTFTVSFSERLHDWQIKVTAPSPKKNRKGKTATFYWAEGKILPKKELQNSDWYTPILYDYPDRRCNPDTMTAEDFEAMQESGTKEARLINPGTAVFFYDFIYHAQSKKDLEKELVPISFLNLPATKIHKQVVDELANIEIRLRALAREDKDVQDFIDSLESAYSYNWRLIEGTKRKSFHSFGIAIDLLPHDYTKKTIFWAWTRDKVGNDWVKTPWDTRWMPPESVIEVFEKNGFIWGGKWDVWDNMHFEYRPEMLLHR